MKNDIMNYALEAANPYLLGPYAPIFNEIVAKDLVVEGEIPKDINGVYVRNGPNPRFEPKGHYHWFDGDARMAKQPIATAGLELLTSKKRS